MDRVEPEKHRITDAFTARALRAAIREGKEFAPPLGWVIFNLPADRQRALWVWMAHLHSAWKIVNQLEKPPVTQDAADGLRIELDDGFAGYCTIPRTAAVVEVVRQFQIPKQFVFEVLHGADLACRFPQPSSFEDLAAILTKLGGGAACGAAKILGVTPGFEAPAIRLGQGLLLSAWLIQLACDVLQQRFRFPVQDYLECGLPPNVLHHAEAPKGLEYFVRLQGQRIEHYFQEAHTLIEHLDFDGARTVTALVSTVWECVVQIMLEPKRLVTAANFRQRFPNVVRDRWKFYLGLEPIQPFFAGQASDHRH